MEEEREKIRELHKRQQDSLMSLQALESKLCKVNLDDEETLQGSNTASRVSTLELMHEPPPGSMPPLVKTGSQDLANTITIDLSMGGDSETTESDATITDDEDEHLSLEELAKCARHVQKLLRRITLLQHSFESSQQSVLHKKKRVHQMYRRFCRKFETEIIADPISLPDLKAFKAHQTFSKPDTKDTTLPSKPSTVYLGSGPTQHDASRPISQRQMVPQPSHKDSTAYENTHMRKKPYLCKVCHKNFRFRGDMKRHEASHSKDANPSSSALLLGTMESHTHQSQVSPGNDPPEIQSPGFVSFDEIESLDLDFGVEQSKQEPPNNMGPKVNINFASPSHQSNLKLPQFDPNTFGLPPPDRCKSSLYNTLLSYLTRIARNRLRARAELDGPAKVSPRHTIVAFGEVASAQKSPPFPSVPQYPEFFAQNSPSSEKNDSDEDEIYVEPNPYTNPSRAASMTPVQRSNFAWKTARTLGESKSKSYMTVVRKKAMDSYLKGPKKDGRHRASAELSRLESDPSEKGEHPDTPTPVDQQTM